MIAIHGNTFLKRGELHEQGLKHQSLDFDKLESRR